MLQANSATLTSLITTSEHARIREHYDRAMPWLADHFAEIPLIYSTYPAGLGDDAVYHKSIDDAPATITTIDVTTSTGIHKYVRLNPHNVTWLVAGRFAVELDSWSPSSDDPQRASFGRITLAPNGSARIDRVVAAMETLRDALEAERLQSIAILDGFRGAAVWIPFDDKPGYDRLGPWLHAFAASLAGKHPELLTTAARISDRGNCVSLGTKTNYPGMGTLLPYAVRGTPGLEVVTPIPWQQLSVSATGHVTAVDFDLYQRENGDVFGRLRSEIGSQQFGSRAVRPAQTSRISIALAAPEPSPKGFIIAAAVQVLAAGDALDATEILARALANGLLPPSTSRKYVYTALHEYVERTLGAGRIPRLIQVTGTSSFRLNEPVDVWPAIALPPLPLWLDVAAKDAIVQRLRDTASALDTTSFEVAVCDAFTALGFVTTHIGGNGAPDGVLAAPLGSAGYRAILECKTASLGAIVANPRPEEPAKFRERYDATHAILIGPAFGNDSSLDAELVEHQVSLWTVDDLVDSLEAQIGPDEMRPLFAPGRAELPLRALLWERDHGRRKRVAFIATLIAQTGWTVQQGFARGVPMAQTPAITEETLFVLVDDELIRLGVTSGATIDEARDAIRQLEASGLVRANGNGLVITQPRRANSP